MNFAAVVRASLRSATRSLRDAPTTAHYDLKVPLISGSDGAHIGTTMLPMTEQELHFLNQRTPPTATIAIVPILDHAAAPKHGQLAYFNTLKISHKNEGSLEMENSNTCGSL